MPPGATASYPLVPAAYHHGTVRGLHFFLLWEGSAGTPLPSAMDTQGNQPLKTNRNLLWMFRDSVCVLSPSETCWRNRRRFLATASRKSVSSTKIVRYGYIRNLMKLTPDTRYSFPWDFKQRRQKPLRYLFSPKICCKYYFKFPRVSSPPKP